MLFFKSCKYIVGISTCRLIVLPPIILYHASLNSRACFVCVRCGLSFTPGYQLFRHFVGTRLLSGPPSF